ncbi:MAG: hypothetical protein H6851_09025 [Geminicoccaceae bacterium]|nr:hypothetical protein [Geminicoccaceae bacterium]MCB9943745.1 hypothetical protein [Geminicoccaceae bacterium]
MSLPLGIGLGRLRLTPGTRRRTNVVIPPPPVTSEFLVADNGDQLVSDTGEQILVGGR